mgnify:CR=1 FL=1
MPDMNLNTQDGPLITMNVKADDSSAAFTLKAGVNSSSFGGPKGNDGADGADGEQGPQGIQGIQGEKGDTGDTGPQGEQGEQGIQGETGLQGPQGDTGPAGPQGEVGPAGATGPQGIQGPTGATGPAGSNGNDGADGAKGDTGDSGPQGIQGEEGPQGPAGADGSDGVDGEDGTSFSVDAVDTLANRGTYDTEAVGFAFLASDTGDLYIRKTTPTWSDPIPFRGPQGETGPAGADGNDGADGATGPAGADGADSTVPGPQGDQGIQGEAGPKGDTGDTGPQGIQGPAGADGSDGADGLDGDALPVGGTAGQVLAKIDDTDGNAEWVDMTGGGSEPVVPTYQYSNFDTGLTTVNPVFGGGMILRNSAYTGPAIRVEDAVSAAQVDIEFDGFGRVAGTRPYGDDTRLVTVYDQWGSEDIKGLASYGIKLVEEDEDTYFTWQMHFDDANAGLRTDSIGSDNPSWELADPLWFVGHQRFSNAGLQTVFGVNHSGGGYLALGLWIEGADLHWRVDGNSGADWTNTDWVSNAVAAQGFSVALGDLTQQDGTAYAYYNGASDATYGYVNPVDTYNDNSPFYLGGSTSIGTPFDGVITEFHMFDRISAANAADITYISDAGAEPNTIEPVLPSSEFVDAPVDGSGYLRQDADWQAFDTYGPQIITILNNLIGYTEWQNPASVPSVSSRYWSIRSMGTGRYNAREVAFKTNDGNKVAGTYSASSTRLSNVPANANDDNTATYWEAGTGAPDVWFAVDFGEGNDAVITGIEWNTINGLGPNSGSGLYISDDGVTWELLGTIDHGHTWVDGVAYTMDISEYTLGEFDAESTILGLDTYFGNTDWREGGSVDYIDVDTDVMTGADDGKGLMWQDSTKTFILSTSVNGPMLLGGGQELIVEHDLAGNSGVTIDMATHNLDQYDEIMIIYRDTDGRMDIEFSTDGGTTTQSIVKSQRGDTDATFVHTQAEFGPDADNLTGSMGVARVTNLLGGAPTTVEAHGGATGGGNALSTYAVADDISLTNAIILTKEDATNFTVGTVWVVGIKKSNQPVEILHRWDEASMSSGTVIMEKPVLGIKFRAGVIGEVRCDVDNTGPRTVNILNEALTVVATCTMSSGEDRGDIIAAADVTITDTLLARWENASGPVVVVDVLLRGELA